jgi:hypothetical protein
VCLIVTDLANQIVCSRPRIHALLSRNDTVGLLLSTVMSNSAEKGENAIAVGMDEDEIELARMGA